MLKLHKITNHNPITILEILIIKVIQQDILNYIYKNKSNEDFLRSHFDSMNSQEPHRRYINIFKERLTVNKSPSKKFKEL